MEAVAVFGIGCAHCGNSVLVPCASFSDLPAAQDALGALGCVHDREGRPFCSRSCGAAFHAKSREPVTASATAVERRQEPHQGNLFADTRPSALDTTGGGNG